MIGSGKRRRPEAAIQMAIVRTLWLVLPAGSIVHASLNEEASGTMRKINAAMGACAGFSDLMILAGGRHLYLEVKTATGRQSDDQRRFQRLVEAQGQPYEIVRSVDDALRALEAHAIPTRIVSAPGTPATRIRVRPVLGAPA